METLSQWYGHYRFSDKEDGGLFNTDMILYFISNCLREGELPEEMIDQNVRIDYGKLRHLIVINQGKTNCPSPMGISPN
ncbi:MAG: hypothetical protein GY757_48720 [bacterium]|nr:hypothetical protein [bacterium]